MTIKDSNELSNICIWTNDGKPLTQLPITLFALVKAYAKLQ
jgi:hypothetical protein